jgi:allophanate hydrolase subunit 2
VEFTDARRVAATGADMAATLNGVEAPRWQAFRVKAGDVLKLGAAKNGVRAYLAVSGGIDTPPVLGSRATYPRGQLGGLGGRALKKGDDLPLGPARAGRLGRIRASATFEYANEPEIGVVLGPQEYRFTARGIAAFLEGPYEMLPQSDRMGARLRGPVIEHTRGHDLISDGICSAASGVGWQPSSCSWIGSPREVIRRSRRYAPSRSAASARSGPGSGFVSAGSRWPKRMPGGAHGGPSWTPPSSSSPSPNSPG